MPELLRARQCIARAQGYLADANPHPVRSDVAAALPEVRERIAAVLDQVGALIRLQQEGS